MEISVIMLTYNRASFVSRAIESILAQDFDDYELILVDNGSTDKSGIICDNYAKKHNQIKVIHRERGNIGSGRNAGLDVALGNYIAFIDDDDIAYTDMLQFLYTLAKENNADISICGSLRDTNGAFSDYFVFNELKVMSTVEGLIELLKRKYYNVCFPTKLVRSNIFNKVRFSNTGSYDDIVTTYKVFSHAEVIAAHGKPKYCFSRHESNNSNFVTNDLLITPTQLDEYFEAFSDRTSYLSKMFPEITNYVQYTEWSYLISMLNKIVVNNLTNCKIQLDYIKNVLIENYSKFYQSPFIECFEKDLLKKYVVM